MSHVYAHWCLSSANTAQYFSSPERFKASLVDLSNILSLCISQEDEVSQHIRGKLNIREDLLTDMQFASV